MEKNLLHHKNPDLQTSREVKRAVLQEERKVDKHVPNEPSERIEVYLKRLERLILDPEQKQKKRDMGDILHTERPRALSLLREKILNEYVRPNKQKMAEAAAQVEERAARQMGIQAEYTEEALEQRGEIAAGDLESSLDQWITYLSDPNEQYPMWFRYYAFRNVLSLGEYDKSKQEFPKRSKGTFKLFPEVDRGALAYIEERIEASRDPAILERIREAEKALWDTPESELLTKEKAEAFVNLPFAKQYAEGMKQNGEITPELRAETRGAWIKYKQGSDPRPLWLSLQNKGAAWCTKGYPTAKSQLNGGDFYVYYTLDKNGEPTIPRIAIRMKGEDKIAEDPRGVFDSQQNIEPNMISIMEEKLKEFGPEADRFKKKSRDMRRMTEIDLKVKSGQELSKDELIFLYETEDMIGHFGYSQDPRINEIKDKRNIKEDYALIFDCEPGNIAIGVEELNELRDKTIVFVAGPDESSLKFGGLYNDQIENLKHVIGNVDFGLEGFSEDEEPASDIGKLETIGGNAIFTGSEITDLDHLKRIGGDADFMNSKITSLKDLRMIGGNAFFNRTRIANFGKLEKIGGSATFTGCSASSLGNIEEIGGTAFFRGSHINDLGKLRTVGDDIYIDIHSKLDFSDIDFGGGIKSGNID